MGPQLKWRPLLDDLVRSLWLYYERNSPLFSLLVADMLECGVGTEAAVHHGYLGHFVP